MKLIKTIQVTLSLLVFALVTNSYCIAVEPGFSSCNVSLSPFTPVCSNNQPILLTGGMPAGGVYTGPGVSSGYFDPAMAGSGTHIIAYSYSDGNGCTGTATQEITVFPVPTVNAGSDAEICAGSSVQLFASASSSASSFQNICIFDAPGGNGNCTFTNNLCNDGYVWATASNIRASLPFFLSSAITSIQFDLFFSCGSNTSFEFYLNGALIGSTGVLYNQEICNCQPQNGGGSYPYSRIFSGPAITNAAIVNGNNVLSVKYTGSGTIALAGYRSKLMFSSSTYSWSPSSGLDNPSILNPIANPENSTTYTLTVTDNTGCFATDELTVNILPEVDFLASTSEVSCYGGNDGSINIIPVTGSAPYFCTLNNGIYQALNNSNHGLPAGTHSVKIRDSKGCESGFKNIIVSGPAPLSGAANITPVSCPGLSNGSIGLIVQGGTPPYSYNWLHGGNSTLASNLSPGNYQAIVSDAKGCSLGLNINMPQPSGIIVNAGQNTSVVLGYKPMECTTLTGSCTGGTGPYTYAWSNGSTNQSTTVCPNSLTTYTLTATDQYGCSGTGSVTVDVVDVRCDNKNDMVQVCINGKTICVGANAAPNLLNINGNYLGPCSLSEATFNPGDSNEQSVFRFEVYPNPSKNGANIKFSSQFQEYVTIELLDFKGTKVKNILQGFATDEGQVQNFRLETSGLSEGIYLIRYLGEVNSGYVKFVVSK